jgi:phospho-N-acetylmuramoyl-pentapeptide-transferase
MGASVVAMVLMLVIGPPFIRWLRLNEFGQNIREEGPEGHKIKEGTPTMGGVLIWFAVLIPFMIFSRFSVASITVLIAAFGNALIGFADDWTKIVRKRSLGLSARYKLLLQLVLALFIGFIALHFVGLDTRVDVPFTAYRLELGTVGFYALIFLILAGFSNAVNLTDGLDGLAAGSATFCFACLAIIGYWQYRHFSIYHVGDALDLALASVALAGACLGFLWWNAAPAKIFMGDTGSLSLGSGLAALCLLMNLDLLLIIIGGLFVIETLSVVMQVISFRVFHRRVFLMAPIHHHFELRGWPETTVIVRFWILAGLFAALGLGIFYGDFLSVGKL